jgi:CO/xanthine dehydrogenase Mo-binding subunit
VLVDYEPLPPVLDVERAIEPGAALARTTGEVGAGAGGGMAIHGVASEAHDTGAPLPPNVAGRYGAAQGDAAARLDASAVVVGGRFRTHGVHQGYIEPQAATAWLDPNGSLVVHASTQGVAYVRPLLAQVLGWPVERIRVSGAALGGAFGGKIGLIEPLVAAAALAVQRPVRVVVTRSEDFTAANPAPAMVLDVRIGADEDGRLAAIRARALVDDGAYSEYSSAEGLAGRLAGPYRWDAWDLEALAVTTNRPGAGAYRAPGGPQAAFALESLLDELAERLGLDAVELRRRNLAHEGDPQAGGGTWPPVAMAEALGAASEHPVWTGRHALPEGEGVGLAVGAYPGSAQAAGAVCRMDSDGGVTVVTGLSDMTGTASAMAAIAAETLGLEPGQVRVEVADSSAAPQTPVSAGSTITYSLGSAVLAAAQDAREQLLAVAAERMEIDPDDLEVVAGVVRPRGAPASGIPVAELARAVTGFDATHPPIEGHGRTLPPQLAPSAAAHLAHVRVDPDTGAVAVLRYVAIQDVGHAINPALCEGQLHGGAAQAIGWALLEELDHDEAGQLVTGSFLSYGMPSADAVPPIETRLLEIPSPHGPLGAKGIGESAVVPGAAAIANAVAAATRRRPRELPMSPQRVWLQTQPRVSSASGSTGSRPEGAPAGIVPSSSST